MEAFRLAKFVNENAQDPLFWKDSATAAKRIVTVTHLLLSLPRPADFIGTSTKYLESSLVELIRLALLIMLARLKREFLLISEDLEHLRKRLSVLSSTATYTDTNFPELALWAYIIVASMERTEARKMHVTAIFALMNKTKDKTSTAAIASSKGLIWINSLMDSGVTTLDFEINNAYHA